jgi:hypothetical protein
VIPGHAPSTYLLPIGVSFPISNIQELQQQSFKAPNVTSIMKPLTIVPNLTDYANTIRKIQIDSLNLAHDKITGASNSSYFFYYSL